MPIVRELLVVAVHGEGDQATVNANQKALNKQAKLDEARAGRVAMAHLDHEPDLDPQILVVLRDEHHHHRIELHLESWEDVEAFKAIAGYDASKRHWVHGGKVKITIG